MKKNALQKTEESKNLKNIETALVCEKVFQNEQIPDLVPKEEDLLVSNLAMYFATLARSLDKDLPN